MLVLEDPIPVFCVEKGEDRQEPTESRDFLCVSVGMRDDKWVSLDLWGGCIVIWHNGHNLGDIGVLKDEWCIRTVEIADETEMSKCSNKWIDFQQYLTKDVYPVTWKQLSPLLMRCVVQESVEKQPLYHRIHMSWTDMMIYTTLNSEKSRWSRVQTDSERHESSLVKRRKIQGWECGRERISQGAEWVLRLPEEGEVMEVRCESGSPWCHNRNQALHQWVVIYHT